MHVAVTGATGFLGRYIVNRLLENDHTCRCWSRPASDRGGAGRRGDEIQWVPGRLNDQEATEKLVNGVDAVVHSALERSGGWNPSDRELLDFVQTNVVGTIRLMQTARATGSTRFIFVSTCAVHDVILNDRPLDESHPLWPTSHYGAHKAAIEKFVHSFGLPHIPSTNGWDICALRPTGVYGIARPVERSKWFALVSNVVAGKPIDDNRGGKEVHAADVANAVSILLATPPGTVAGQSYNCYDMYVTAGDVAQIAKNLTGSTSIIKKKTQKPKNQIDTSKLRSLGMRFGGQPLLAQTVAQLVDAAGGSP